MPFGGFESYPPRALTRSSRSSLIVTFPVIFSANAVRAATSSLKESKIPLDGVFVSENIGFPFASNPVGDPFVSVSGAIGLPLLK